MVINTGSHPAQLWPGIKKINGATYNEKPMVYTMVFDKTSSEKAYEKYVEETGFGLGGVKAEGDALPYDTDIQGYTSTLTNVTYALGAKISMEAIQDNQYFAVASRKAKKLARSMRQTKETVFANILNRAFTSATGGDGKELCATDHPTLSGTQANEPTVGADFSEAALEDAMTAIRLMTDSRGLRIQLTGKKLILPPQLEFEAHRVLKSTLRVGTADNDINAIRSMGMLSEGMVVWDYLTDSDAWFIKTDADEGLIAQERMGYTFDQDNDFDTKNACMAAIERYAGGWHDWRALWGNPGS